MKNPHHALFRPAQPEDSCIAARHLQRQAAREERKLIGGADKTGQQERVKPSTDEVTDDDLPMIFFESADA